MDDQREVLAIAAIGDGQEAVDDQPVAGGVLDGLHRRHLGGINPLREVEQFFHLGLLFVADVQQVVGADGLLAVRMEEHAVLLFRPVLDVVGHAGQRVVDHRLVVFVILVEPVNLRPLGLVAHPEHLAGLVGHDRRPRRHVVRRVGEDHPAQFPRLEVVLKQRSLVAIERGDVEDVGVRAETKRLHGGAKIGGVNFLPIRLDVPAMNDRPDEAMLSDPDPDDIVAVGDELQDVAPIEHDPFFLPGEGVEPDDVAVEGPFLPEPAAALAHLDQNVPAFIRQRVKQLDGLEHAAAEFPVCLVGGIEHLVLGAVSVHGVQAAVGEIVAILHLENQALVADPVETVHLVFVLRSATKQFAVGEANGEQVVFALTRRDGSEPLAVRREAHPVEFRVLEEGLDRQFLRLAKRAEQARARPSANGVLIVCMLLRSSLRSGCPRKGLNCTVWVWGIQQAKALLFCAKDRGRRGVHAPSHVDSGSTPESFNGYTRHKPWAGAQGGRRARALPKTHLRQGIKKSRGQAATRF